MTLNKTRGRKRKKKCSLLERTFEYGSQCDRERDRERERERERERVMMSCFVEWIKKKQIHYISTDLFSSI